MNQNYVNMKRGYRWLALVLLLVFSFQGARVSAQCTKPSATIATPGVLSCTNRTITLHGSTSTVGASYSWTSTSGFTSYSSDPVISMPGTYYLVVTTPVGACSSDAVSVVVTQDTVQPDARTHVSDTMTCARPTVTINGLSNSSPVSYSWIGPSTFTATTQNINVTVNGGYTLMVKNTSNGCVSTAVAYVVKNVEAPTASAYVSGDLTCVVNSVNLTSSSATQGVTYRWTGPAGFTAISAQNTSTLLSGTHTVTTTNPHNGCTSSASVDVIADKVEPGATVTPTANTITCSVINSDLAGNSPSVGVTYLWSSPTVTISYPNVQNITVADSGTYVLTVTKAQNGCTSAASTKIAMDKNRPVATGSATPTAITCTTTSVQLNATSSANPASYKWVGPAAFGTQLTQNPTTAYSGGYVLSVTNTNNGCITTKAVVVSKNVSLPLGVAATNSGDITCKDNSTITGSSSTTGASFIWTSPTGASLTGASQSVATGGTYTLTVTHPTSGCTAITSTTVNQNVTLPSASANNDGAITCLKDSSTLTGNSSTIGVTYEWATSSGGTAVSTSQNYKVGASGTYYLRVINPANGCKGTSLTVVNKNVTPPLNVTAGNSNVITCQAPSSDLNASSTTSTVAYNWSGPGFSSTAKGPTVNAVGSYTVTVTNTANGCTATASTVVTANKTAPGASITQPANITCAARYVTIPASATATDVVYKWSGPSTFNSTEKSPSTNQPGSYTVTVTDNTNGCTSTASTVVGNDTLPPANVVASALDSITCVKSSAQVKVTSANSLASYSWSGPQGNISTNAALIAAPVKGSYKVTVTGSNGCTATASAVVVKDSIAPANVAAVSLGIINCTTSQVTVTGSSTTPNVTYLWSGPNISAGTTTPSVTTTITGDYRVTVTNPKNGCTATALATVNQNKTVPAAPSVSANPTKLTCSATSSLLTASSATTGVEYAWSGPGLVSNEATATANTNGTFNVTVTHTLSRCTSTGTTTVTIDTTHAQNVNAQVSNVIKCNAPSSTLTASSNLASGVTYTWSGPAGFGTVTNPIVTTTKAGLYNLAVTNNGNGCVTNKPFAVFIDTIKPKNVTAVSLDTLGCKVAQGILEAHTTSKNVDCLWHYLSDSNFDQMDSTAISTTDALGSWVFIATNTLNGCKVEVPVQVLFDETPPTIAFTPATGSTVLHNSVNTISTVAKSTYDYTWATTNGWSILGGQGTSSLTYNSGNTGTSSTISLHIEDNRGCTNDNSVTLTSVATKSAFAENQLSAQTIKDVELTTYPTPAVGKVNVEFASPEATDATVTVYNATTGSVVASLFDAQVDANQPYKLVFNENETLPAGVYICILKTKTKTITNKIVISK